MNSQLWSWVLTAIGLLGFYLISRKVWWAWYINLANQMVWLAYSVVTKQWGFLVGVLAYTVIFGQAAYKWTKEHKFEKAASKIDDAYNKIWERLDEP